MSRRPEECQGRLVFQEGKKIEGEYYVVAVYDDPSQNSVVFAAYELETDKTFTLQYKYCELDELFRFNSELINPKRADERYHWVIERMDFVLVDPFNKKLCLALEAVPEETKKTPRAPSPVKDKPFGGKLDEETRIKLLNELERMDDSTLQLALVQSENARKAFLHDLHSRRRCEQVKALQRIDKIEEGYENRLEKLAVIEKMKKSKAQKHMIGTQTTMKARALFDTLMKQHDEDFVRKLVTENGKEAFEREQRHEISKYNQRRSEVAARQQGFNDMEHSKMLNRRREEAECRREEAHMHQARELLTKRQHDVKLRLRQGRKAAQTHDMEENVANKHKLALEKLKNKNENERLERVRGRKEHEAHLRRTDEEMERISDIRTAFAEVENEKQMAREEAAVALTVQSAEKRKEIAATKAHAAELDAKREENIRVRLAKREKARKEAQWLQDRQQTTSTTSTSVPEEVTVEDERTLRLHFEADEREKRRLERVQRREEEDKRTASVLGSTPKLRDAQEVRRIQRYKEDEYERQLEVEHRRMERERRENEIEEAAKCKKEERETAFYTAEAVREENENERYAARHEKVVSSIKTVPVGWAIPVSCIAI